MDQDRLRRLEGFSTSGKGLEIAPYFNPMLFKSECDVLYTDYIGNDEIARKAAVNPGAQTHQLPPKIDFVWRPGKLLKTCAPRAASFDFVLASHVLEHVPNPIGWLNDVLSTMNVGAALRVVLPDKRRTTDYHRNLTTFGQLLAWWQMKPAIPTAEQVADFLTVGLYQTRGEDIDENGPKPGLPRAFSDEQAWGSVRRALKRSVYVDVHCSVWIPEQFISEMRRAAALGLISADFRLVSEHPYEFVADIVKMGEPSRAP